MNTVLPKGIWNAECLPEARVLERTGRSGRGPVPVEDADDLVEDLVHELGEDVVPEQNGPAEDLEEQVAELVDEAED